MVPLTKKHDWFTAYLVAQGFWVGGSQSQIFDSDKVKAIETIRILKGANKFTSVLILDLYSGSLNSKEMLDYARKVKEKSILKPDVVLFILHGTKTHFSVIVETNILTDLDTNLLLRELQKIDPTIVGKSKQLKNINKTYNDYFHRWARTHLKGFQTDVDAILREGNKITLFELKRPQENISSWEPYFADINNYLNLQDFCSLYNYELINIAYNSGRHEYIKVFQNIVNTYGNSITYESSILEIKSGIELISQIRSLSYGSNHSAR